METQVQNDREILEHAIIGYEAEQSSIDSKIGEIRNMLGSAPANGERTRMAGAATKRPVGRPAKTAGTQAGKGTTAARGGNRKLTAAGRKKIAMAAKKRWAEFHAAKRKAARVAKAKAKPKAMHA